MSLDRKNHAKRLQEYRQLLKEAGFKRVSAYISFELIVFLKSKKQKGECLGRTLERLLLGNYKIRPGYHSDKDIRVGESQSNEAAKQQSSPVGFTRAALRSHHQAEWKRLKNEVMVSFNAELKGKI